MSGIEQAFWLALLTVTFCAFCAWHIRRHPWMNCLSCGGSGKKRTLLDPYGPCRRCGGSGRRRRFAAWLLRRDKETGR